MATRPANVGTSAVRRSWIRTGARYFGAGVFCYALLIGVLMFFEDRLLFFPYTAAQMWEPPPNDRIEDVRFIIPENISLHGWWCPTENWMPEQGALIYCQGNAGNLSMRAEPIEQWLREFNTAVLIFGYPGYGRSEGKPSEEGCYAAAGAAYDWLTLTKRVRADKIIIYGSSLGGAVATDLASKRPHRALVLLNTFTSIPETAQWHYPWLPARRLVRNQFDSLSKIGRCDKPIFIAHGTADDIVPFQLGKRLFEAAREPKYFLCLGGRGHDEMLDESFLPALASFIKTVEENHN